MRRHSLWSQAVTKQDMQMRLGWRGMLGVMLGTALLAIPFVYWKRFDLALPTFVSVAMISLAIKMRWRLRHNAWFWITMSCLCALHVPLVLCLPLTGKWISAVVIAPFGVLDLHVMLWTVAAVGSLVTQG